MPQPLAGRRILVTRAAHQAGKLSAGLLALGAEPVEVPLLEIQPPAAFEPLDRALRSVAGYDWILFTSANTVRAVADRARELALALAPIPGRIAAVGAATADALLQEGLAMALVPERYVAEGLIEALSVQGGVTGRRILLARAAVARDVIPDALRAAGATVDVVDAYRNALPANAAELLRAALAQPVDAALFTSSSTAEHLAEAARLADILFPLAGVAAISIGPITTRTLLDLGWTPAAEACPHDIPGLLEALARAFR
ncbi:MAG TPA: uroporphyrinogen-III synthase [Terracidiphilus sp.]|jgi:uroporphyrinogen-III synthase/uroporphyrinogen III methyltransferase/synthase|nr:uroporphyrinogen-III synthase [Terracidiphilus sp.]